MLVLTSVALGTWSLPLLSIFTDLLRRFDVQLPWWGIGLGAIVFVFSLALRWRAHADLGRYWSFTVETADDHALVTRGIYGVLRHPIYVSMILWAVAQPLLLQNAVAGFGGVVAAACIWLVRVPLEERMMLERFGTAYRDYLSRTGRILPRLRQT